MKIEKSIPKFHETFNPILEVLRNGVTIKSRELVKLVIAEFYNDLSTELLNETTKSGDVLIENRILWGKSYLKKGGYIEYPKRGFVKITEKGLNSISKKLKLKDIESNDDFLEFYKGEQDKSILTDENNKNLTPQDLIDSGFSQIEDAVKSELLEKLKNLDPYYFEKVILILLRKMGYGDFIETSKSGDGGIDGIINEDKLGLDKIYIQAKRYGENKVREKDIRNFIGAMSGDTSKGVFVTTSDFHERAVEKAKNAHHTIILINGYKLVNLMHEYNVGVQIQTTYEVKELDMDFFDGE